MKHISVLFVILLLSGLLVACNSSASAPSSGVPRVAGADDPSGSSAVAASPEACLQTWVQFADTTVSNGDAVYGGYTADGSGQFIDPSITPSGCDMLSSQTSKLTRMGCRLDHAKDLAESLSQASDASYRRCQALFPDNWSTMCLSKFAYDQRMARQAGVMYAAVTWQDLCK